MKLVAKNSALLKARTKLAGYLAEQDLLGEKIAKAQEAITKGEGEVKEINELCGEMETLKKEDLEHAVRIHEIMANYDSIPWRSDLRPDEKLEYDQEFRELARKRTEISERLSEIPKEINKVYYRR